jgi:hypothetical protein
MSKRLLLTSVSVLAVAAFQTLPASAADLKPPGLSFKAPEPFAPPTWTWWLEGGAQGLAGGDPHVPDLTPGFAAPLASWGWDVAGGFDYRFGGEWHVVGDFRYGQNRGRTGSSSPLQATSSSAVVAGTNAGTRREYNWDADFMVGRDIGIGRDLQIDFGVRVAQIRSDTNGLAQWNVPSSSAVVHESFAYQQSSAFLGAGPRLAVQGSIPFASAWSIDYEGGAAVLVSLTSLTQAVQASPAFASFFCAAGCPVPVGSTQTRTVFNTDAMVGLGYAITPNAKVSLNYHIDAYFDALSVVDGAGNITKANRVYQGPSLRLTYKY